MSPGLHVAVSIASYSADQPPAWFLWLVGAAFVAAIAYIYWSSR